MRRRRTGATRSARPGRVLRAFAGLALFTLLAAFGACAVRVPRTVSVAFPAPAGTIQGALYLPDGPGPHPGIVLVHGARRTSYRDFVEEARFFAGHGIAALAYDTRGTGRSSGDPALARFDHMAHDAIAAARFLRARGEIDSSRVGFHGDGQAGWIASLAAALDSTAAFVLLVSAPAVPPIDELSFRRREELVERGMDPKEAAALTRLRQRIWEYWLAPAGSGSASSDSLRRAFEAIRKRAWFAPAVEAHDLPERLPPDEGMGAENHPALPWVGQNMPLFWSLQYDPLPALERIRAPILAVYGEEDREVPVRESERRIRRAVGAAFGRRVLVRIFPEADHSLRVGSGKGLLRKIEAAPGYRDTLTAWLGRVAAPTPTPAGSAANH